MEEYIRFNGCMLKISELTHYSLLLSLPKRPSLQQHDAPAPPELSGSREYSAVVLHLISGEKLTENAYSSTQRWR